MNLKKLRKKAGLTQAQLAKKMKLPQQSISAWETEVQAPSLSNLIKLAKVLKCKLDDLV